MAAALDMSLDDIIKASKQNPPSTNLRGRLPPNSGTGPSRRIPNRFPNRTMPYSEPTGTIWLHDMFMESDAANPPLAAPNSSMEIGIKVLISNLDYGVSDEDIKELFSGIGDLKQYSIHYDRSGRSKGTAEVVFSHRVDALQAINRYNNVELDGKPMKIEIVGPKNTVNRVKNAIKRIGAPRSGQGSAGGGTGQARGSGRRVRGWNRNRGENVSAEDLDADLEKYHAEALETS